MGDRFCPEAKWNLGFRSFDKEGGGRKSEVTRETRIGQGELRSQVQYPGSMRRVNNCEHQDVMAM